MYSVYSNEHRRVCIIIYFLLYIHFFFTGHTTHKYYLYTRVETTRFPLNNQSEKIKSSRIIMAILYFELAMPDDNLLKSKPNKG